MPTDPRIERRSRFFSGLATGAICGTGLALLLAPRTGSALRRHLVDVSTSLGAASARWYRTRMLGGTESSDGAT